MTDSGSIADGTKTIPPQRYRLPGIEREGIAQLSLLETALWPLQSGKLPSNSFQTTYDFTTAAGRKTAHVTVRAGAGLQTHDELVLWGLLGATLAGPAPEPVLLARPYWMLRHLGLKTGGKEYHELRESLLRLALTSYQNTGFYNPETQEHEYAAFQFLSMLLPTVGGAGETVDDGRCWRIEWNPAFFRFCKTSGGNLLFDLDLFRQLTPASRRLFLKLKDRFWRSKRVFLNVADLTVQGLGFSAARPLYKRKFDLANCIRELLDHHVLALGRGQTDVKDLFIKHGKGSYVVVCYEGDYFRQPVAQRSLRPQNAIVDDPLYEPLQRIGVDGPGIRRLLKTHKRGVIQRWMRITDAAMHEKPRGFDGFSVSPAAFLIDGITHGRTQPDWMFEHEKRQRQKQFEREQAAAASDELELRRAYQLERAAALQAYLASAEARQRYEEVYPIFTAFHKVTKPHRHTEAAHDATIARIELKFFQFPDYAAWAFSRGQQGSHAPSA